MRTSTILSFLFMTLLMTSQANAGTFYAGADVTNLKARIKWQTPRPNFIVEPTRIKIGYQSDSAFGIELHAYSNEDITTFDDGFTMNLKLKDTYGIYAKFQDPKNDWVYIRAGITYADVAFTAVDFATTNRDTLTMPTVALGFEWTVLFVSINVDYTYMESKIYLPDITEIAPGLTNPSLVYGGLAIGANIKF